MEKLNVNGLITDTRQKLGNKNARQLAVFHTGIIVAAAVVITALQYMLTEGIGNTSGLSGLGRRSALETLQTVLQWANMILTPFWSLGFLNAALRWSRDQQADRRDLLTGFHRFGSCLGLMVNRALLTICVMILCINLSSGIYMMMPAADALTQLTEAAAGDMNALAQMMEEMDAAQTTELLYGLIPALVIWGCLSAALLIPLLYRFRMAEFVILDQPRARGLSAMLLSAALLRRRCWQLFRLDLHFWWYYALKLLCLVICYADMLLPLMGVELPMNGDALFLLTYGLYLAALFGVEVAFRPQVDTAYAGVYDTLKEKGPILRKMPEKPQNVPWDQ